MQTPPSLFRPLAVALGTLTVLRIPVREPVEPAELRLSTAAYPVVGLLVGAIPALLLLLLPLPPGPRAALALAAWVVVTGALHVDGWGDCCDAALAPPRADAEETRLRRLAILKDPRMGVFGVTGIVLLLLGKWTALAHVVSPAAPLAAAALARWAMVYTLSAYPAARPDGLAATLGRDVPLWAATVLAIPVLASLIWTNDMPWTLARALVFGIAAALLTGAFLARRFGGITGDVCGAVGEMVELVVLWSWLPWGVE